MNLSRTGNEQYGNRNQSKIPNLISDPIAITEYKGPKGIMTNTASVYGMMMPNGKTPIVVGVMMIKAANGVAVINKVRTIHARGNAIINDENIFISE